MKQLTENTSIRNIAIIAHVDHGKTTLVDSMFRQSGVLSNDSNSNDRVMDSMDLERERGITISAKNCSVTWKGVKINILDTPGHADFGGEVERALMMVDGVILLVDAAEGPLPQTRFVLKKSLDAHLKTVVVLNKIDRSDSRPAEILDQIYELFFDLDATEEQINFPILYAVGRDGVAMKNLDDPRESLTPLFETVLEHIPGPKHDPEKPFQMLVTNLDYSDYLGRLAIGRVFHGSTQSRHELAKIGSDGAVLPLKVSKLQTYSGVSLQETQQADPGDIIILAGVENVEIGDTICERETPVALPRIAVDEPTVSMTFSANTSPLAGKEGKFVTAQKIGERLKKETLINVGLRVENAPNGESYVVKGRGEFQLAILIETMRREGFELTVGPPKILFKEKDGQTLEPIEHLFIDCDEAFLGVVTEKLSTRKGKMLNLVNHGSGRVRVEFTVPSRGLIGYRSEFLTDTRGTGILNSILHGYEPHRGEFPTRMTGSLVSDRTGEAVAYGIFHLEPRGAMFVIPGDPVYEGMIVGEHNRDNDLDINICRTKKLSNMRASGKDDAVLLTPVIPMTLEHAIEFIRDDELIEVTPKSVRLRKAMLQANKR